MFWDFLSLVPESLHQLTILFSDRGTPKVLFPFIMSIPILMFQDYRHMDGFSSHTLKLVNSQGTSSKFASTYLFTMFKAHTTS